MSYEPRNVYVIVASRSVEQWAVLKADALPQFRSILT